MKWYVAKNVDFDIYPRVLVLNLISRDNKHVDSFPTKEEATEAYNRVEGLNPGYSIVDEDEYKLLLAEDKLRMT